MTAPLRQSRVLPYTVVAASWVLAWLAGLWCVYGRAWAGQEFTMPKAGYVVFESFSKVAWSLALAWVILACAEVGDLHHRASTPRAAQGAELVYKSVLYDPIAFSCVYCIQ